MWARNPSRTKMEKARGDFQTLYQREEPHTPDTTLATHVESVQVSDATPSHAEVEATVCRLHPFTVGGHTHLHAYHFKQWMLEAYPGRTRRPPSRPSDGCVWWKLFNTCGSRGDSSGVGVHCLGTHTQRYHIHLGNRPTGDPL